MVWMKCYMVCLSRGYLSQILLGPFMNTLTHLSWGIACARCNFALCLDSKIWRELFVQTFLPHPTPSLFWYNQGCPKGNLFYWSEKCVPINLRTDKYSFKGVFSHSCLLASSIKYYVICCRNRSVICPQKATCSIGTYHEWWWTRKVLSKLSENPFHF